MVRFLQSLKGRLVEYDEEKFREKVISIACLSGLVTLTVILITELVLGEPDWWITLITIILVALSLGFLYFRRINIARVVFITLVVAATLLQGIIFSSVGVDMRWVSLAIILLSLVASLPVTTLYLVVTILCALIFNVPQGNHQAIWDTIPIVVLFYIIAYFISNVLFRILRSQKAQLQQIRQTQQQLVAKEKLASIGELAAGIAHEINNPLMGIMNYVDLVLDDIDHGNTEITPDSENYQFLKDVVKEANRIANITKEMLIFARKDEDSPIPINILEVIDRSVTLMAPLFKKEHIIVERLYQDSDRAIPLILGRPNKLQQVFLNFLRNSQISLNAKYPDRDDRKKIQIDVDVFQQVGPDGKQGFVSVSFKDFGVGLKKEFIPRVFEPFFSTRRGMEDTGDVPVGIGLGLSICYQIIHELEGRLWVDSKPGKYFTIVTEIPAAKEENSTDD